MDEENWKWLGEILAFDASSRNTDTITYNYDANGICYVTVHLPNTREPRRDLFTVLCSKLTDINFSIEKNGDYLICTNADTKDIIILLAKGKTAKKYQMRRVNEVVDKYRLGSKRYGEL